LAVHTVEQIDHKKDNILGMKKRKTRKEEIAKMGDLNLDKVL